MSDLMSIESVSQRLVWDQVGERVYQTGLDRGVLYLTDGAAVPWNGLTSVEEAPTTELKTYYLDGVRHLQTLLPSEFTGKLKAFTYPDEFDLVNGIAKFGVGLSYHDQPPKSFNLSYRTRIGNDLNGTDHGYKLHLLYNVLANPDGYAYETISDAPTPIEFAWTLTGTPEAVSGHRPTMHISINSIETDPAVLEILENMLYGSEVSAPRFPTILEVAELFGSVGALIIVDNGDGTWTAIDSSDDYITMLDETTFQIDNADATFLDISTYEISTTNPG
jgi:hypothetical protein